MSRGKNIKRKGENEKIQILRKKLNNNPYRRSKEELENLLKGNPHLDLIDIDILSLLQIDGRASYNTIAETLGISVATVSKRVHDLESLGVLTGFSAIVECDKLGFGENLWLMLYLKPGSDVNRIGNQVSHLRGVKSVYSLFSDFDLLVHLCCATEQDVDNAIQTIGLIEGIVKVTKMSVYKKIKQDFRVQI